MYMCIYIYICIHVYIYIYTYVQGLLPAAERVEVQHPLHGLRLHPVDDRLISYLQYSTSTRIYIYIYTYIYNHNGVLCDVIL